MHIPFGIYLIPRFTFGENDKCIHLPKWLHSLNCCKVYNRKRALWNLFCIHILVFQILENDSNIKREEEDQDKITLGSRQSDIKNPKEKSGCCWYLIKTCMNEHIVNMSWMSELYSRVFWVASQTCLLFRLLKEVMWTSFLILWLYVFHTLNCDALCVTGQHILINWHMFLFLSSKSFCFFAFCSKVYHKRIEDNQGGFFFLFLIF